MKKKIIPLLLALIILYCLLFPADMAASVSDGLTLWYRSILPTLLPFSIFSNIIIRTGIYDRFFAWLHPAFRRIYPVRSPLIYPLLAGFLFGFPLGSKICADLCREGKISPKEAEIASSISNNFGPAFIYNFLYQTAFDGQLPAVYFFAACYLPPILLGRLWLMRFPSEEKALESCSGGKRNYIKPGKTSVSGGIQTIPENTKKAPGSQINMEIMDAGIMDGFSTMIKLAGYIMLSALLADMIRQLPLSDDILHCICIGAIEITNGIQQIRLLPADTAVRAVLAVGIVNFGGLSGLSQTRSMMRSTGICMKNYICFKLLCSLCGMAFLFLIAISVS
ncbi:MAG: hypothetical protein LUG27_00600 [Clostridiales bacterium]|nr:hypothetical protein [Clostridiales bacterium]MCD8132953.1 hypothetical protein [Clostridiales bacterium]